MANICQICGQETPCCRCDAAWLEMKAKLYAANQEWREKTRKEIGEQLLRPSASSEGESNG